LYVYNYVVTMVAKEHIIVTYRQVVTHLQSNYRQLLNKMTIDIGLLCSPRDWFYKSHISPKSARTNMHQKVRNKMNNKKLTKVLSCKHT